MKDPDSNIKISTGICFPNSYPMKNMNPLSKIISFKQKNIIKKKKFESYNNFYIFRFSIIENTRKMKKILFALILSVIVGSTSTNYAFASTTINSVVTVQDTQDEPMMESTDEAPAGFTQELKKRFIEGGPGFMGIVLICLILGLAISIERIIYLNLSTTNSNKLTDDVEDALKSGGVEAAKEVCRNTKRSCCFNFLSGT